MYSETWPLQARRSLDGVTLTRLQSSAADLEPKRENKHLLFWKFFVVLATFVIFALSYPSQSTNNSNFSPQEILHVINQDRATQGLKPLRLNVSLENAARNKAEDMFKQNYFAHTSPSGTKPWDFIKQQKISYIFAGENLARGYTNAYELEKDLLESPSHRENLLSPIFSEVGIATIKGTIDNEEVIVTVQMFATPVDQVALR